ncbi:MAG: hypothetical protein AAF639_14855 [Chloroflexota bacterium]
MLRKEMRRHCTGITGSQGIVATFMIEHYDSLPRMTLVQMAQTIGVVDTDIVRLCRRMGFKGYPELLWSIRATNGIPPTLHHYYVSEPVDRR